MPVWEWGVVEVANWIDAIGLSQYRKRFLHNCITGRLLVKLTDEHLKVRKLDHHAQRLMDAHVLS